MNEVCMLPIGGRTPLLGVVWHSHDKTAISDRIENDSYWDLQHLKPIILSVRSLFQSTENVKQSHIALHSSVPTHGFIATYGGGFLLSSSRSTFIASSNS
jgi:hypothetical protein